jgi:hypothetical protein
MKLKAPPPGQALGMNDMQQNRLGVTGDPGREQYRMNALKPDAAPLPLEIAKCGRETPSFYALPLPLPFIFLAKFCQIYRLPSLGPT